MTDETDVFRQEVNFVRQSLLACSYHRRDVHAGGESAAAVRVELDLGGAIGLGLSGGRGSRGARAPVSSQEE